MQGTISQKQNPKYIQLFLCYFHSRIQIIGCDYVDIDLKCLIRLVISILTPATKEHDGHLITNLV